MNLLEREKAPNLDTLLFVERQGWLLVLPVVACRIGPRTER